MMADLVPVVVVMLLAIAAATDARFAPGPAKPTDVFRHWRYVPMNSQTIR